MNAIFMKILKVVGWQKAIAWAWKVGYKALKEAAAKTEAKWDDEAVEVLNEIIKEVTEA